MSVAVLIKGLYSAYFKPAEFFGKLKNNPQILVPFTTLMAFFIIYNTWTLDLAIKPEADRLAAKGVDFNTLEHEGKHPFLKLKLKRLVLHNIPRTLVYPFIIAAFTFFWMSMIRPGSRYRQALSLILYGEIIYNLGALLKGLLLARGINISFTLAPLAEVFGFGDGTMLFHLLSKIEFFLIWEIILIAIGMSVFLE